jgi:hypothetical protein
MLLHLGVERILWALSRRKNTDYKRKHYIYTLSKCHIVSIL